jgi:hypothetical protein
VEKLKIMFLLITGVLTFIGACLPWWTVTDLFFGTEITVHFNPIFGASYIPATLLSSVVGIIAMIGGVFLFVALKSRNVGTVGGFIAIIAVISFIPVFYIDDLGGGIVWGETLGLFDQLTVGLHDLTTYLGYGWYLTLIGAVLGIIASRMMEHDVA